MKPSRERIVAAVAVVVVMAAAVAAVVVVTAVVAAVIATTIVTSANHAGNINPQITQILFIYLCNLWMDLFSGLRRNLQSQLLRTPHYLNCVLLTGFHFSERIRVVVNVLDLACADLDDAIPGFESCFRRR